MKGFLENVFRFFLVLLGAAYAGSLISDNISTLAGIALWFVGTIFALIVIVKPTESGLLRYRSTGLALLIAFPAVLSSGESTNVPAGNQSAAASKTQKKAQEPAPSRKAPPVYKEADFFWDNSTRPWKKIIIEGVNRAHRDNPRCVTIDPGTVGKSSSKGTQDNPVFFVACGEGYKAFNYFFSKEDVEQGRRMVATKHLSQEKAVGRCEDYARRKMRNPSTVEFSRVIDLSVQNFPNGNTRVTSTFTAENQIGMQAKYEVSCLVNAAGLFEATHMQIAK